MNLIIFILGLALALLGNHLLEYEGAISGLGALTIVIGFMVALGGLMM